MQAVEFGPLKFTDVSGGMMSAVEDALIPDNACKLSLGFRYDKIGRAKQRNGYAKVGGSIAATTPDGLSWFNNSAGTQNRVVAAYNGAVYGYNGTTWTNVGGSPTPGTKVRFAPFLDLMFMVGGGGASQSWNGNVASVFGTTQLSGAPSGTLVLPYKSKLYIAGNSTFPDRLYFSTIPDVSGLISWDTTLQYLDVNPSDGDNITALAKTGTQMLIFKRDFIYRWNGTSTDAEPVINVGTVSQETVANVNGSVIFFNPRGVFSTDGGIPVEISRPVKDFIDAISPSDYSSLCTYSDQDRFGLFIPSVTVDNRTFTNLVLEYDTNTQVWQPHLLAHRFYFFTNARTSAGADYVAGAKNTYVEQMFTGNDDDGSPIVYERRTRAVEFDGRYSTKEVNDGMIFLSGGPGAVFSAIPDDKEPVKLITSLNDATLFKARSVRGNRIAFSISGSNKSEPVTWEGFWILKSRSLGLLSKN